MISRRHRIVSPPPARPRTLGAGELGLQEPAEFPIWPVMIAWGAVVGTGAWVWWSFFGPGRRYTYPVVVEAP